LNLNSTKDAEVLGLLLGCRLASQVAG